MTWIAWVPLIIYLWNLEEQNVNQCTENIKILRKTSVKTSENWYPQWFAKKYNEGLQALKHKSCNFLMGDLTLTWGGGDFILPPFGLSWITQKRYKL